MASTKTRRPAVRPHAFVPDTTVLDARGRSRSCAICKLGPTNTCHAQNRAVTPSEIPADVAAFEARRLGERLEDD